MRRTFLLFGLSITLASCTTSEKGKVPSDSSILKSDSTTDIVERSFSNPALIYGSSIGELVQQLYKQGRWTELIKFISSSSIKQFGEENIIRSFQRSDFGYEIKLKSMSMIEEGRYLMNYQTLKFGTLGVLRMNVVVENDTAKIVIKEINSNIQFDDSYDGIEKPYFGC